MPLCNTPNCAVEIPDGYQVLVYPAHEIPFQPPRAYHIDTNDTPATILKRGAESAARLARIHTDYLNGYTLSGESTASQRNLVEKYTQLAQSCTEAAAVLEGSS